MKIPFPYVDPLAPPAYDPKAPVRNKYRSPSRSHPPANNVAHRKTKIKMAKQSRRKNRR